MGDRRGAVPIDDEHGHGIAHVVGHPGGVATWFSADLHFGHRNIISYCARPFADIDEMNVTLIHRWNEVVDADDVVWVLGDVAMGRIAESLPLARRLHGRKVLVAGNHDRCWHGHHHPQAEAEHRWREEYHRAGFCDIVQGQASLAVTGVDGVVTPVEVCHFPYAGDSQEADRHGAHRPVDEGAWLIHGHVHERWRQHGRQINVGTDVWDYRPVSEVGVAELIAAGPRTLDRYGDPV